MRGLLLLTLVGFVNSSHDAETNWLNSILNTSNSTITEQSGITDRRPLGPEISSNGGARRACTTDDNKDGFCVRPSLCTKEQQKTDPTAFILKEKGCINKQVCCQEDKIRTASKPAVSNPGCGWSNPGANNFREKSDIYAEYGEFPWMVALLKTTASSKDWSEIYLGGGSLIHPSVVMTVAHKFAHIPPNEMKCRAGEWNVKTAEVYPYQEKNVKRIILHDDYDRYNLHYDVALLIMETPFSMTNAPHMGLACLGAKLPDPRTQCYTMGWGEELENKDEPITLKKRKYPLLDAQTCERNLKNSEMDPDYSLHTSFTCVDGEVSDVCTGDGGSPLVCQVPNQGTNTRYAVYGMVVNGRECGSSDVPAVYVNVPQMYSWINRQMELNSFKQTYVY